MHHLRKYISKKNYGKQFTAVTIYTHKNVQSHYNEKRTNVIIHWNLLYMHQKYGIIALRLFLKDKGAKQYCLITFVGSNLGVETFLKKREQEPLHALRN